MRDMKRKGLSSHNGGNIFKEMRELKHSRINTVIKNNSVVTPVPRTIVGDIMRCRTGTKPEEKGEEMQCEVNQNNPNDPVYLTFDLIF